MAANEDIDSHIHELYAIKERLGKGAYGIVWRGEDRRTGQIVALKKIFDAFRNPTDAQRTFREIMYLQEFRDHSNIVTLLNVVKAKNDQDLYLVFDHMDLDLRTAIEGRLLTPTHRKHVMYQLVKALVYMHSGDVIHRDLKPDNALLNEACDLKLCDFGLARSINTGLDDGASSDPGMTEYVATRWYRAPEMLLGSNKYSKAIDAWSLGCIFAQIVQGKPLFMGSSSLHQVDLIVQALGRPLQSDISDLCAPYARNALASCKRAGSTPLSQLCSKADDVELDLLKKLLVFSPRKRLTMEQAVRHPYFAEFFHDSDLKVKQKPVELLIDHQAQFSVAEYRRHLYKEIAQRRQIIQESNSRPSQSRPIPAARSSSSHPASRRSTNRREVSTARASAANESRLVMQQRQCRSERTEIKVRCPSASTRPASTVPTPSRPETGVEQPKHRVGNLSAKGISETKTRPPSGFPTRGSRRGHQLRNSSSVLGGLPYDNDTSQPAHTKRLSSDRLKKEPWLQNSRAPAQQYKPAALRTAPVSAPWGGYGF